MLIRCKIARPALPAERNRPDVIEKLVEHANWFMANGVLNHCVKTECDTSAATTFGLPDLMEEQELARELTVRFVVSAVKT